MHGNEDENSKQLRQDLNVEEKDKIDNSGNIEQVIGESDYMDEENLGHCIDDENDNNDNQQNAPSRIA